MMGAGIALVSAQAGIDVVLIDQTQESADKGKNFAESHLNKGIKLGKTSENEKESILSKILPTTDLTTLSEADLIVEAVFEDLKIKSEITKEVEGVISENCIFASNTSTLPITDLAKASSRPNQFIGDLRRNKRGYDRINLKKI